MTQFLVLRRIAGIIRSAYRALDSRPDAPLFDTYGDAVRRPPSFTHNLFLS
jgi:hypothetical protein